MPRDYDGGDIRFRTLWIDNSALGTGGGTGGGVTWALEARSIDDGDNIDVPWNTPIIVNDDSNGLDKLNISSQSDLITPGGSPAANKPLSLRLSRDVDDAGDDLNKSVSLIGIQIQYVVE